MIFDGDKANSFTAYTARIVPQTHRAPEPKCTLNPDAVVRETIQRGQALVIAEIILASRAVSLPFALHYIEKSVKHAICCALCD